MHRLIKPIIWTALFLLMMLVIDQLLVQVPPVHPAHSAVSNFYRDFRSRLIDLAFNEQKAAPKSIEAVIEKQQKEQTAAAKKKNDKPGQKQTKPAVQPTPKKTQRYLYSDDDGELQFTDSLDEVPEKHRPTAQPMGQ